MQEANKINTIEELCAAIVELEEAKAVSDISDIKSLKMYVSGLSQSSDIEECFKIDDFTRKNLRDRLLTIFPGYDTSIDTALKNPSVQELHARLHQREQYVIDCVTGIKEHFFEDADDIYERSSYSNDSSKISIVEIFSESEDKFPELYDRITTHLHASLNRMYNKISEKDIKEHFSDEIKELEWRQKNASSGGFLPMGMGFALGVTFLYAAAKLGYIDMDFSTSTNSPQEITRSCDNC